MMHFVRTLSIMRDEDVRRIAIREVRNYGKILGLYIRNIFKNGWWVDAYPSGLNLPTQLRSWNKLRKLSKESGIFVTINLALFY